MRISDWSSDVCSSDLHDGEAAGEVHAEEADHLGVAHAGAHDEAEARELQKREERRYGAGGDDDEEQPPGREEDEALEKERKSVVEGKRVSVRVELGGRRNMKKKKTKTPNRHRR